jgi:hypothetical protein
MILAPEGELLSGGSVGHGFQPLSDLTHVLCLPVLRVQDQSFALYNVLGSLFN